MFLPSRLMSVLVQILPMQGRKQLDSQKPNSMRFGAAGCGDQEAWQVLIRRQFRDERTSLRESLGL